MKISEIIHYLESIAPKQIQESYDNCGLLVGEIERDVTKALICLDVTEDVIQEAIDNNCQLIISHHPVIFKAIKKITTQNFTERILLKAIRNELAIYAIHTNLDQVDTGVNFIIAEKIGLKNTKILSPVQDILCKLVTFCPTDKAEEIRIALFKAGAGQIGLYDNCSFNSGGTGTFRASEQTNPYVGEKGKIHFEPETRIEVIFPAYTESAVISSLINVHPYEEPAYDIYPLKNNHSKIGSGMIGELENPSDEKEFLSRIKTIFRTGCIRHSKLKNKKIKRVAVCGGSGSFLISNAIAAGADIFITADIKYHDFFIADNRIVLADIGHYESEWVTKELLFSLINKKFPTFALQISEQDLNPVNYF